MPNAGVADVDDDEDDVSKPLQLSFLTVAHLNSNEPLIRARVVLALKNAQDNIIPHTEMLAAIVRPFPEPTSILLTFATGLQVSTGTARSTSVQSNHHKHVRKRLGRESRRC